MGINDILLHKNGHKIKNGIDMTMSHNVLDNSMMISLRKLCIIMLSIFIWGTRIKEHIVGLCKPNNMDNLWTIFYFLSCTSWIEIMNWRARLLKDTKEKSPNKFLFVVLWRSCNDISLHIGCNSHTTGRKVERNTNGIDDGCKAKKFSTNMLIFSLHASNV